MIESKNGIQTMDLKALGIYFLIKFIFNMFINRFDIKSANTEIGMIA